MYPAYRTGTYRTPEAVSGLSGLPASSRGGNVAARSDRDRRDARPFRPPSIRPSRSGSPTGHDNTWRSSVSGRSRGTSSSAAVVRPNCWSTSSTPCSPASSVQTSAQQRVVVRQVRPGDVHHGNGRNRRLHLGLDAGVVARGAGGESSVASTCRSLVVAARYNSRTYSTSARSPCVRPSASYAARNTSDGNSSSRKR